jgi:hypothetical protein
VGPTRARAERRPGRLSKLRARGPDATPATGPPDRLTNDHKAAEARQAGVALEPGPWLTVTDSDTNRHEGRVKRYIELFSPRMDPNVQGCSVPCFPSRGLQHFRVLITDRLHATVCNQVRAPTTPTQSSRTGGRPTDPKIQEYL